MLSLGDLILSALLQLVWVILIQGPLCLLSIASYALQFMSGGLQWTIFFNTSTSIVNGIIVPPSWSDIKIPWPFIGMLIISFIIGLVVFIIQMCKIYATSNFQEAPFKIRMNQTIKLALSSIVVSIAIPLFYFLLTIMMTFFIAAITKIFSNDNTFNLADYIYNVGFMGNRVENLPLIPGDYSPPSNSEILQYNFLVQILATYFSLIGVTIMSWMIILKTIELLFLYFTGPVFSAIIPTDGGRKMNLWKDMVISKNCVIIANYMGYWLFMYLLTVSTNVVENINPEGFGDVKKWLLKSFILLAFIGGSAIGTWQLGPLLASFFGDSFGMRESMSQMKGLVGGAILSRFGGKALGAAANIMGLGGIGGGGSGGVSGVASSHEDTESFGSTLKNSFTTGIKKSKLGFLAAPGALASGLLSAGVGLGIKKSIIKSKQKSGLNKLNKNDDNETKFNMLDRDQKLQSRIQNLANSKNQKSKHVQAAKDLWTQYQTRNEDMEAKKQAMHQLKVQEYKKLLQKGNEG